MSPYQLVNILLNKKVIQELILKKVEESMPSHLGIFVLSHRKKIMNKIVLEIDQVYSRKNISSRQRFVK